MTLRFDLYDKLDSIPLVEASLLWLEIEPTPELIESPPYDAQIIQKLINSELRNHAWETFLPKGKEDPVADLVIQDRISAINWPYGGKEVSEKEYQVRHLKACIDPITLADRTAARASIPSEFKSASLKNLREIAIKLGEKPKFLFPEMREGVSENNDGWNKGEKGKASYKELMKVLLHELKFDPNDSGTAGKIEALATKHQTDKELKKPIISRRSIDNILNEIDPSRVSPTKSAK